MRTKEEIMKDIRKLKDKEVLNRQQLFHGLMMEWLEKDWTEWYNNFRMREP